jgi:hypothetical protein
MHIEVFKICSDIYRSLGFQNLRFRLQLTLVVLVAVCALVFAVLSDVALCLLTSD